MHLKLSLNFLFVQALNNNAIWKQKNKGNSEELHFHQSNIQEMKMEILGGQAGYISTPYRIIISNDSLGLVM